MNNEKMGQFISELRKSHQMTQKELAAKLNVSDKAVSKWERGLSCPDISLLSPLSNIFGVTTTELLNGEKTGAESANVEVSVVNALEYGEKTAKRKIVLNQNIWSAAFTISLLIGIAVVSIVNVAVSGGFTWSLIPISACIFAWLVFFPAIKYGAKGIVGSLLTLSVFIVPFLYVLDLAIARITEYTNPVFPLGIRVTPLSLGLVWVAYFLFKKLKKRKLLASAILVLLICPVDVFINVIIADMLGQPLFDVQTMIKIISITIVAIILFIIDIARQKRN